MTANSLPAEATIDISDPQIQDDGFFSVKYLDFKVKLLGVEKSVRRRDKDFNTLRQYLSKMYPHVYIPTCPPHKKMKKYEADYLNKRKRNLQRFLNKVLHSSILRASPMVYDFLTFDNAKDFTKTLKTAFDKDPAPKNTREFVSLDGKFNVSKERKYFRFGEKYTSFTQSYEVLMTKMHNLNKKLSSEMRHVSDTIGQISDCCKHLSTVYKLSNTPLMSEMYKDLE